MKSQVLRSFASVAAAFTLATLGVVPAPVAAQSTTVELSNNPLATRNLAKPNIIIGYDDSGSMDWETIINGAKEGTLWYSSSTTSRFWDTPTTTVGGETVCTGRRRRTCTTTGGTTVTNPPVINSSGSDQYGYIFPNGSTSSSTGDVRRYGDGDELYAIPPIPAYAFVRSNAYNSMYYNPAIRYTPWKPAYIDGALRTFSNASPTAARSHPYFPLSGTATTMDLTAVQYQSTPSSNFTFRFKNGMVIPTSVPWHSQTIRARQSGSSTWSNVTSAITVGSTDYDVMIPYYPAEYWSIDSTCTSGSDCATAWDGQQIRRTAIISTTTSYPKAAGRTDCAGSTCTYAEEIQNFANWFQYYRKRRLAMAAGMGNALADVKGIRADSIYFNGGSSSRPDATMYDFSSTDDSANAKRVIGKFYRSDAQSGTPIRSMMKHIGGQFARTGTDAPIQFGCQRNASFIATDGYNTDTSTTAPSYTAATWMTGPPYTDIISNSLADIAGAYYTINPRPDLATGLLSVNPSATGNNVDRNTNLHVNQYAVTLGAFGSIFGTGSPSDVNPFINPPTWPSVGTSASTAQIDDLWHATINGRGEMHNAYDAADVSTAISSVVRNLIATAGSDAGVAVSSYNLSAGNNTAFVSSYNAQDWSGDLAAFPVNLTTGSVDTTGTATWRAGSLLTARDPATRLIASHDGSGAVAFASGTGGLTSTQVAALALTSTSGDGQQVLDWLRGVRTGEGTTYRTRSSVLGDIVTAEPAFNDGVVYQPANDGMLHAFDAATGAELWAYVPYNVLGNLKALANPTYSHRFYVDGTPTIQNIGSRTILVGGLRGGGAGYYAIDITDPRPNNMTQLRNKILWELPNASTSSTLRDQLGASYGRPLVVRRSTGQWVVIVTSGYNNASGGNHLHVLDAVSGALLRTITTPSGHGLAQVSAWVNNPTYDPTVDYVYGGDLAGNVWRFDLRNDDPSAWSVVKFTTFPSTQPVTTAPELTTVRNRRLIIINTGRLLAETDNASTATQSVYGLVDDLSATPTIANPRDNAVVYPQTLTIATSGIRNVTSGAIDWTTYKGWRFDLPSGERATTDPMVAFGTLVFTTNMPSSTACDQQSFLYAVNTETGGQLPASNFTSGTAWTGRQIGYVYASRPLLATIPGANSAAGPSLVALTNTTANRVNEQLLPMVTANRLRRHGWREVLR